MESAELSPWSKRRWWWSIAAVFAAQTALLIFSKETTSTSAAVPREKTSFSIVTRPLVEREIFDSILASDPTMFVLPGRNDFSGEAWLKNKSAAYEPPEWNEPQRWLNLDVSSLGETFVRSVRNITNPPLEIAEAIVPRQESSAFSESLSKNIKPSSLRVEGDLAQRRLLDKPKLPSWNYTEPLADTVLQVSVKGAGDVAGARLLSPRTGEPGSFPAATQKALEIARALRFEPVNASPLSTNLTWGRIIFSWRTEPVPKTNVVSDAFP